MHLSDHNLRQIDDAYNQSLEVETLRGLSARLLADLKDARDRLNQGTGQQFAAAEQLGAVGSAGRRAPDCPTPPCPGRGRERLRVPILCGFAVL
jgi:hypothetical protein